MSLYKYSLRRVHSTMKISFLYSLFQSARLPFSRYEWQFILPAFLSFTFYFSLLVPYSFRIVRKLLVVQVLSDWKHSFIEN